MNKHPMICLLWTFTLAFTAVTFGSSARALSERIREASGKEASVALLESEMKKHAGQFCAGKLLKLVNWVDDRGVFQTRDEHVRELSKRRALKVAKSLPPNHKVVVSFCEGSGENATVTTVAVVHAVWNDETSWMGMVVRTESAIARARSRSTGKLTEAEVAKKLLEVSRKQNASLPRMIGESVRHDAVVSSGNVQLFIYTVLGVTAAKVDADGFRRSAKAKVLPTICEHAEARLLLESGARFLLEYDDEHGKEITTVRVLASDCE